MMMRLFCMFYGLASLTDAIWNWSDHEPHNNGLLYFNAFIFIALALIIHADIVSERRFYERWRQD